MALEDEGTLRKWMALELHRLNEGTVRHPVPLPQVRREGVALRRDGGEHRFDPEALRRLHDALPLDLRGLRVPFVFYETHQVPGEAYLMDRTQIQALRSLGETDTEPLDGKLWMGLGRVLDLRRRWPTLVQHMVL